MLLLVNDNPNTCSSELILRCRCQYSSYYSECFQEYPYQLSHTDDKEKLAECLCDWAVFDQLYHEEFSSQLLIYWRKVTLSSSSCHNGLENLQEFYHLKALNGVCLSDECFQQNVCNILIIS